MSFGLIVVFPHSVSLLAQFLSFMLFRIHTEKPYGLLETGGGGGGGDGGRGDESAGPPPFSHTAPDPALIAELFPASLASFVLLFLFSLSVHNSSLRVTSRSSLCGNSWY